MPSTRTLRSLGGAAPPGAAPPGALALVALVLVGALAVALLLAEVVALELVELGVELGSPPQPTRSPRRMERDARSWSFMRTL
jgi:hypothetical protein